MKKTILVALSLVSLSSMSLTMEEVSGFSSGSGSAKSSLSSSLPSVSPSSPGSGSSFGSSSSAPLASSAVSDYSSAASSVPLTSTNGSSGQASTASGQSSVSLTGNSIGGSLTPISAILSYIGGLFTPSEVKEGLLDFASDLVDLNNE